MADQVVRERVELALASSEGVESFQGEIRAYIEEALKTHRLEKLLYDGQMAIEVEASPSHRGSAQVLITLLSRTASDAFKEIVLPSLMKRYKTVNEPESAFQEVSKSPSESFRATTDPTLTETTSTEPASTVPAPIEPATPFQSLDALAAAHTELLQRELDPGGAITTDFLEEVKNFIRRGRETGTRLEAVAERRIAQSFVNYWITVLYRAGETKPPDAILAAYSRPAASDPANFKYPYIGLNPFTETDHELFFGRQQLTGNILGKLKEKSLAVLAGPSGSGKTSAINAGVVRELKEGKILPGSEKWYCFPPITPGLEPLASLASLFVPREGEFTERIKQEADKLLQDTTYLFQLVSAAKFVDAPVVIIVDQFEEVFTLCKDDPKREAFIANLLNLIKSPTVKHRLILSMRSDRINYIIRRADLSDPFRDAEVRIFPLSEGSLHDAIEKPAQSIGLKFQPNIIDQLIREIYGDPIGLPLLQFTLLKLWENKEGDTITWASMNQLNSCRNALVQSADEFYKSLKPEEKAIGRRIFLKMVRLSEALEVAGEQVRRADFYQASESSEHVDSLLEKLVEANLVRIRKSSMPAAPRNNNGASAAVESGIASGIRDGEAASSPDDQFELAHESLVRYWPKLDGWVKKMREAMVTRQRLEAFAANWVILGKSSGLLDKFQLHEAETWLQSQDAIELGYDVDLPALVQTSRDAIKQEEFGKRLRLYVFIGVILAAFTATLIFALIAQHRLTRSMSRQLAAQSRANKDTQLDLALLLSLESYRKDNSFDALSSMVTLLAYSPRLNAFLQTYEGKIDRIAFSSDGQKLSSLNANGATTLWDIAGRAQVGETATPFSLPTTGENANSARMEKGDLLLSHAGKQVALIGEDQSLTLWDVEKRERIVIPASDIEPNWRPFFITYSSDDKKLAWLSTYVGDAGINDSKVAGQDYMLTVWDVEARRKVQSVKTDEDVELAAFSPDNQTLAYATSSGNIVLRRTDNLKPIGKPLQNSFDSSAITPQLVFSRDGKNLASLDGEGAIVIWRVKDQKELGRLTTAESITVVSSFALSSDGETLVAGYNDGSVAFWDWADKSKESHTEFRSKHSKQVTNIAFSSDDKKLITVSSLDGSILLWDTSRLGRFADLPTGRSSGVADIAFSPDNKTLAAGTDDGSIILWDLEDEQLLGKPLYQLQGRVISQIFNTNGTHLFSRSAANEIVSIDVKSSKQAKSFSIQHETSRVEGAVFGQNRKVLAVSHTDDSPDKPGGYITLWDVEAGKQIGPIIQTKSPGEPLEDEGLVSTIALSADGKMLANGDSDGQITLWALESRAQLGTLKSEQKTPASSLAFSSDGTKLASGNDGGVITLWDVANMKKLFDLPESPSLISSLAFTLDGTKLISTTEDGTISFWDISDANQQNKLLSIYSVDIGEFVFSPDGKTLAAVSINNEIVLWDIETQQQIGTLPTGHNSPVISLAYTPDGKTLAAGHEDGTIMLVSLGYDAWRERACRIANRNLSMSEWLQYKILEDQTWRRWFQFWRTKESFYCKTCPNFPSGKDAPQGAAVCD